MTLNFHKKPQRDFVFHFFFKFLLFLIYFIFFALYFFFQHADVHATACWRIGSYAPAHTLYIIKFGAKRVQKVKILYDKDPIGNKLNLLGFMGYPRLSNLQYL